MLSYKAVDYSLQSRSSTNLMIDQNNILINLGHTTSTLKTTGFALTQASFSIAFRAERIIPYDA